MYSKLTTKLGINPGKDGYLKIAKILDLQAFGNSIVDILVAKTVETLKKERVPT